MDRRRFLLYLFGLMICCGYKLVYAYDMTTQAIQERIKPLGEVNLSSDKPDEVELLPVAEQVVIETLASKTCK